MKTQVNRTNKTGSAIVSYVSDNLRSRISENYKIQGKIPKYMEVKTTSKVVTQILQFRRLRQKL